MKLYFMQIQFIHITFILKRLKTYETVEKQTDALCFIYLTSSIFLQDLSIYFKNISKHMYTSSLNHTICYFEIFNMLILYITPFAATREKNAVL